MYSIKRDKTTKTKLQPLSWDKRSEFCLRQNVRMYTGSHNDAT